MDQPEPVECDDDEGHWPCAAPILPNLRNDLHAILTARRHRLPVTGLDDRWLPRSKARKSGSHLTPRWREADSNRRSPSQKRVGLSGGTGSAEEVKRAVSKAGDRRFESCSLHRRVNNEPCPVPGHRSY